MSDLGTVGDRIARAGDYWKDRESLLCGYPKKAGPCGQRIYAGMIDISLLASRIDEALEAIDAAAYERGRRDENEALPAAPKAPSAEGWQPIETAPKDGTLIIVYRPTADGKYINKVSQDWWGLFGSRETWARSNNAHQPTHWIPLPAPPQEKE